MKESTAGGISPRFPYESVYVEVHGQRIHYIDEGEGDTVLFLHGNPTSSYLWRNIIPYITPSNRCVAMDLIGMGCSDRPDIEYRFTDHYRYVEGFIEALKLKNITLVVHDWGSALGLYYASQHEENVRGLAFMEAILKTYTWEEFPPGFKTGFRLFRTPVVGWLMISVFNLFINQIMPKSIVRKMSKEEMEAYRKPFPTAKSRRPVRRWPCEIPVEGSPADVTRIVESYSKWLKGSALPKLLFYAEPGGIIGPNGVKWCGDNLKNLSAVDIGPGVHYLQEDNPHLIGRELKMWLSGF